MESYFLFFSPTFFSSIFLPSRPEEIFSFNNVNILHPSPKEGIESRADKHGGGVSYQVATPQSSNAVKGWAVTSPLAPPFSPNTPSTVPLLSRRGQLTPLKLKQCCSLDISAGLTKPQKTLTTPKAYLRTHTSSIGPKTFDKRQAGRRSSSICISGYFLEFR